MGGQKTIIYGFHPKVGGMSLGTLLRVPQTVQLLESGLKHMAINLDLRETRS